MNFEALAYDHTGLAYGEVLSRLHIWTNPDTYFEVGVAEGHTFTLATCASLGVDPAYRITDPEILSTIISRPSAALYRMGSDEFFEKFDPKAILGGPIKLAFLDGMHHCEFLLRDFINTERNAAAGSLIVLHDCLPVELGMASRTPGGQSILPHHDGWWTGDVWRTALLLKRYRPDLVIKTFDSVPTGLVCVSSLDPASTLLIDDYDKLVNEMRSWVLEAIGIPKLFVELGMTSTEALEDPISIARLFSP